MGRVLICWQDSIVQYHDYITCAHHVQGTPSSVWRKETTGVVQLPWFAMYRNCDWSSLHSWVYGAVVEYVVLHGRPPLSLPAVRG